MEQEIRADARREVIEEIRAECKHRRSEGSFGGHFETVADWLEGKSDG
jgi:hypothetical protein